MSIFGKSNILLYRLDEKMTDAIRQHFGSQYEVMDITDDFLEVLSLPADMIILNPDEITDEDYREINMMSDCLEGLTQIVFAGQPHMAVSKENVPYSYYVVNDRDYIASLEDILMTVRYKNTDENDAAFVRIRRQA